MQGIERRKDDTEEEGKKGKVNTESSTVRTKKNCPTAKLQLGSTVSKGHYSLKQWMNYLTNLILNQ